MGTRRKEWKEDVQESLRIMGMLNWIKKAEDRSRSSKLKFAQIYKLKEEEKEVDKPTKTCNTLVMNTTKKKKVGSLKKR